MMNSIAREAQVFCYLTSWSAKRPGAGRFSASDLQTNLCTHLIYAFATLSDHKLAAAPGTEDQYHKVVSLRDSNPKLQVSELNKAKEQNNMAR